MEPPQVTLRSLLLPTQLNNSGAITPRNTSSSPIWATCKYICQFFKYATPQVSICFFGRDEQIIANFCKIVSKRETQSPEKSTYTLSNSGPVTKVRPPRQFGPHFKYICHEFFNYATPQVSVCCFGRDDHLQNLGVNPKGTQSPHSLITCWGEISTTFSNFETLSLLSSPSTCFETPSHRHICNFAILPTTTPVLKNPRSNFALDPNLEYGFMSGGEKSWGWAGLVNMMVPVPAAAMAVNLQQQGKWGGKKHWSHR
jgi:hypothetical protein